MQPLVSALKVRPGEGRLVALQIGVMFCAAMGGAVGVNSVDALFFARFGAQFLPYMYIGLGVVTCLTLLGTAMLLGRIPRERLYVVLPAALVILLLLERVILSLGFAWFYPFLWLGANMTITLQVLFTWGLAGLITDTRQAKRLFPLFGAGHILGSVTGGFITAPLARFLHSENLLFFWAGALALAFLLGRALAARAPRAGHRPLARPKKKTNPLDEIRQGYDFVRGSRLMRWILASGILFSILFYSLILPFSKAAALNFPDEDTLAGFLGTFQGIATGSALLVSLFFANRLFARFGIMTMRLGLPVLHMLGFGILSIYPVFPALVAFRFFDVIWAQGISSSAYQAVFNVVPANRREQTRMFISAVPDQAGTLLSGLILAIGQQALQPGHLYLIGLGTAAVATYVVWQQKRAYRGALVEALKAGQPQVFYVEEEPFGGFLADAGALSVVLTSLESPDLPVRRAAVEILSAFPHEVARENLLRMLNDTDVDIRVAALRGLVRAGLSPAWHQISACLLDPEPAVRAEAVGSLRHLAVAERERVATLRPLLDDPSPAVRARCALVLLEAGDHTEALATLQTMAKSGDPESRIEALKAFGEWGDPRALEWLSIGLDDPLPRVRRTAADSLTPSLAQLAVPPDAFADRLIQALGDGDFLVRRALAAAISRIGPAMLDPVVSALSDPELESGALFALETLPAHLASDALRAYARRCTAEALRYHQLVRGVQPDGDERLRLLVDSVNDRARYLGLHALRAICLLTDRGSVLVALDNLESRDPNQRANAIETLESIEEQGIVRSLLAIWEKADVAPAPSNAWLVQLLRDPDAWLRACAVMVAIDAHDSAPGEPHAGLFPSMIQQGWSEQDNVPFQGGPPVETLQLLSLMERVLFLRSVSLFAELSLSDLKQIASIIDERFTPPGEVIARQGEIGDELFVIASGEVRVVEDRADGEVEVARRKAGEVVGEMAIISQEPRVASLIAEGNVRVLCIDHFRFEDMLRERPEIGLGVMRVLISRLKEAGLQPVPPASLSPAPKDGEDRLYKYIPKELLAKLEATRDARSFEGERRVVTILFCDVKGSTTIAESLDPEEWAEIMNGAFECLITPIYHYEGTLARLMGDAILAFFGAPISHEDDPERAVRAGLEIIERIRLYREKVRQERGLDFDVRVGIHTGLVVVGEIGSDLRVEYTAMGDAINLAARMEQTAQPGTVQVTENTYNLIAGLFEAEPLGPLVAKGKRQPVVAYRILGPKQIPAGPTVDSGIPLIGREQELDQLRRVLSAARQGRGQVVCLIGETGLGKSRLISEARAEWERLGAGGQPGQWSEVVSLSYAAARPYQQFRQHIYQEAGIKEIDPPEIMSQKLDRMLEIAPPGMRSRARAAYAALLGLDSGQEPGSSGRQGWLLEKEAFKHELFDVALILFRAWISNQPTVVVFDELHWADPASGELVEHLFKLILEKPVVFLCVFRPDLDSPARHIQLTARTQYSQNYMEIVLNALSDRDSRALIDHLLGNMQLPAELYQQIIDRVDGNPFFIEEIVRAMSGRLGESFRDGEWKPVGDQKSGHLEIPDSLHALVMARIDRLEDAPRRTLQTAAVIGPSFRISVLEQVTGDPDLLKEHLQALVVAGLILETGRDADATFTFQHALTREVAYQSILIKSRRELHRRVGEALERIFADRLEDNALLLAYHFKEAQDARARRYFKMAGDEAARLFVYSQALDNFSQALEIAEGSSPGEIIELCKARAEASFLLGRFEAANQDLEAILHLAQRDGLAVEESQALAHMAWIAWYTGRGEQGLALAQAAEAKALDLGDRSLALHASLIIASALQNGGRVAEAYARLRQTLFAGRALGDAGLVANCFSDLASLNNFMGRFDRAAACAYRAFEWNLKVGNWRNASRAMLTASLAEGGRGQYDAALEALETGRSMAREMSAPWAARYPNQRAWLFAELGDWETAYEIDLAGLEEARRVPGFREYEISTLINLVLDCVALGRLDEGDAYLAEAQKDLDRPEFGVHNWRWRTRLEDARARLYLSRSQYPEMSEAVSNLLSWSERTRARKYTARGLALRGQAYFAQGDLIAAVSDFLHARSLSDAMCYLPTRIEARRGLLRIYDQYENDEKSGPIQLEVAEILADIDRQLKHPELRRALARGLAREAGYHVLEPVG